MPSRAATSFAIPALALATALAACSGGSGTPPAGAAPLPAIHVASSAPVGGDGRTWASAFSDLQAALAAARAGDEIWVRQGVYVPAPPGGSRDAAFALRDGVRLYGGFAGTETARGERDPANHPTILCGDLNGDDGPDQQNTQENSYQVVVAVDCGPQTVLDGFTVCCGHADGPGYGPTPDSRDQGAGVNVYGGGPSFANLIVEHNWNANHGGGNDHGDATTWVACTFRHNESAHHGAGLYVHHHSHTAAFGCVFEDNVAATDGAGSYNQSMMGARYEDCTFARNRAQRGAGLYVAPMAAPTVLNALFEDNLAELGGAGVYADDASPWLEGSLFRRNDAGLEVVGGEGGGGGSGGGGVWTNGGEALVLGCTFEDNEASFGGGVYCIFDSHALVTGCTFTHNRAAEAGGLYTLFAPVSVEDCLFERNQALGGSFSVGGGLSNYYSDSVVRTSVFRANTAELGGGGLYNEGEDPRVERCRFEGNSVAPDSALGGGGLLDGYFTRARVESCVLVGNSAPRGGGLFELAFSEANVVNCTLTANAAGVEGGGIYATVEPLAAYANCIVSGNAPDAVAGTPFPLVWSLVEGGHAGLGNVDGEPSFLRAPSSGADGLWGTEDDDAGDLRLAAGSLGIDAGWNRAFDTQDVLDAGGTPRFADDPAVLDTGLGGAPLVDLGAYERAPR